MPARRESTYDGTADAELVFAGRDAPTIDESEGLRPATLKIPTSLVDTRRAVSPPLHQAGQFLLLSRIRVVTQHKLDSYRNH